MNLFRLLGKGLLLLVVLFGLTAFGLGQKGPLLPPPKNTPPQAVNPVIFPDEEVSADDDASKAKAGQVAEKEFPLGILPSMTQHKPINTK